MTNREEIEKALKPGAPKPLYGRLLRWCYDLLADLKQTECDRDVKEESAQALAESGLQIAGERNHLKAEVERLRGELAEWKAQLASSKDFLKLSNEAVERQADEIDRLRAESPCGVERHKGADWVERRRNERRRENFGWGIAHIDRRIQWIERRRHDLGGDCAACEREARIGGGGVESMLEQLQQIPQGTDYHATRYDTDDELVLHIWSVRTEQSYDIRMKKPEVEKGE